jgi:hypothetical protein
MRTRAERMMRAWTRPKAHMETEDWLFIAFMFIGSIWAFGLGFIIGLLITR